MIHNFHTHKSLTYVCSKIIIIKGKNAIALQDKTLKMKKIEIFIYTLYLIGIILKLFRLPFHTVFILITLLMISTYYIYCLISKKKELYTSLTGIITAVWLFYLLSILKFFSFQGIVGLVTICLSIILFIVLIKNNKLITANSLFCAVIISVTLFFKILPAHYTYYLFGIKFNYRIEKDYFTLDKYSWFLYNADKQTDAIEVNKQAQKAVELALKSPDQGDEEEYSILIKKHESNILNKNWKEYP